MERSKFTPRVWHSEDKSLTFRMDENGMTDISPGPNSELVKFLRSHLTETQLNLVYPYNKKKYWTKLNNFHNHWAF